MKKSKTWISSNGLCFLHFIQVGTTLHIFTEPCTTDHTVHCTRLYNTTVLYKWTVQLYRTVLNKVPAQYYWSHSNKKKERKTKLRADAYCRVFNKFWVLFCRKCLLPLPNPPAQEIRAAIGRQKAASVPIAIDCTHLILPITKPREGR